MHFRNTLSALFAKLIECGIILSHSFTTMQRPHVKTESYVPKAPFLKKNEVTFQGLKSKGCAFPVFIFFSIIN